MRSIKDAITYGLRKANLGGVQTQDREKFLVPLQTTELTRFISDFEKSDLQQAVDINEAVSKFVVILETAAKTISSIRLCQAKKEQTAITALV